MSEEISIIINGAQTRVPAASSVAAAVMRADGGVALRRSISGQPRGPLCGMGICFECRLTIDGIPHRRSCQILCQPNMRVDTLEICTVSPPPQPSPGVPGEGVNAVRGTYEFDIVIVGAGPAGIAAACAASGAARIAIIDDNHATGGQIWRRSRTHIEGRGNTSGHTSSYGASANEWFARIDKADVTFLGGTQIIAAPREGMLLGEQNGKACEIRYRRLILATGARELFLPFPGWTLPNVMGAGGLQAMVKSGLAIRGKRVVVAGSGPLLLAVAAYLVERGADVRAIIEQVPRGRAIRFALRLLSSQSKLRQALSLRRQLRGVPLHFGAWPTEARGQERLESVTVTNGRRNWSIDCDYLACGFGLTPNIEVASLIGCEITDGAVRVNDLQQTSVSDVYCAGESAGVGGVDLALAQGQIAGYAAIDRLDAARALLPSRESALRFARRIHSTFALRPELRELARPETIVCRCEDVSFERLAAHSSSLSAKLQTRCGMGACQGRICGAATAFVFGWKGTSVRPPTFPVSLETLAQQAPLTKPDRTGAVHVARK